MTWFLVMTACVVGEPCSDENVLQSDYRDFCEIARPAVAREVVAKLGNKARFEFNCRQGEELVGEEPSTYRRQEPDPIGSIINNVLGRVVR